jgi:hypothetical protein
MHLAQQQNINDTDGKIQSPCGHRCSVICMTTPKHIFALNTK